MIIVIFDYFSAKDLHTQTFFLYSVGTECFKSSREYAGIDGKQHE